MTLARKRALACLLALILVTGVTGIIGAAWREPAPLPPLPLERRSKLLFLSSLPLLFNEDFTLSGGGSPAIKMLETRYRLVPISVTSPAELAKGRLLLMAQPMAQAAENLVALDQWVRDGGRVVLLADPMLEWPSKRPLGDPLRPPPMFMDTGLLGHWNLRLDAPDERGPASRRLGRFEIATASPGSLHGQCAISHDELIAHCIVGKGRATIIADADLLNAEAFGANGRYNLDGLLEELARTESD
jgi:hypothetical protein